MGYNTDFHGEVSIEPPLNAEEVEFLKKFNHTRRMDRAKGPYFVDGSGAYGQGEDPDIRNYNQPPAGQPGLWCQWTPTDDGSAIEWDGGEKFYSAGAWMVYIIEHFLRPGCHAQAELPFLQANHTVNGVIYAQGEDSDDKWRLVVEGNRVRVEKAEITYR